MKSILQAILSLTITSHCFAATSTFITGNVFWAPSLASSNPPVNSQQRILEVGAGGNFLTATPFGLAPDRVYGQFAFESDLTLAYIPSFFINRILTLTPEGVVNGTPFATGINRPTGLLEIRTGVLAGHLLCGSFGQDRILDITAGGDFSAASSFATGTPSVRNLVELSNGTILAATSNGVRNITAGGLSTSFATGFSGRDILQAPDGRVFVTTSTGFVFDISGGGSFSAATPFATGKVFSGLAINDAGRLLASVSDSGTSLSEIYDITTGGNFSAATAFATNLPGQSETALDTVPIPEPSSAILILCGAAPCLHRRSRQANVRNA